MCVTSLTYTTFIELGWHMFTFMREHIDFFSTIAVGIFASSFLMLSLGFVTYFDEKRKAFNEIKKIYALVLLHSYNIENKEQFGEKLIEVKKLHLKNAEVEYSAFIPNKRNESIIKMKNYVAKIREFYVVQEHLDDVNKRHILFSKQFNEWYKEFKELDDFFGLGILRNQISSNIENKYPCEINGGANS